MALIVTRSTVHRLVVFEAFGVDASGRSGDVIPRAGAGLMSPRMPL
jgi:hypothetical protein